MVQSIELRATHLGMPTGLHANPQPYCLPPVFLLQLSKQRLDVATILLHSGLQAQLQPLQELPARLKITHQHKIRALTHPK